MSGSFFSVVTIARNNLDGLRRTRDSLFAQSNRDWQWVIVDGASTDGSAEVVTGWSAPNVTVVSEPDRGIYDAMNKGLRLATGDYLLMMNSGDRFAAEGVLDELQNILAEEPVDVLYGASIMEFGQMRIPRKARPPGYIWHGQPGLHQATVFRRLAHLNYLYDTDYTLCGDYDVITRMWRDGLSFRSCPVTISINEFSGDSASGRHKLRLIREAIRSQRNNLRLSWPVVGTSAALRAANSLGAKVLGYSRRSR
jgi:putative colanic acid biosynthesis glycosyltransferase